jgi:hypothetical protein
MVYVGTNNLRLRSKDGATRFGIKKRSAPRFMAPKYYTIFFCQIYLASTYTTPAPSPLRSNSRSDFNIVSPQDQMRYSKKLVSPKVMLVKKYILRSTFAFSSRFPLVVCFQRTSGGKRRSKAMFSRVRARLAVHISPTIPHVPRRRQRLCSRPCS